MKTWPKPPLKESYSIPEIPEEFTIFGIKYKTTDNKVIPSELEHSEYNKEKIKKLIKKSYSYFLDLLSNPEDFASAFEKLQAVHLEINVELNKCKDREIEFEIKRIEYENNKKKNKIMDDLKNILDW